MVAELVIWLCYFPEGGEIIASLLLLIIPISAIGLARFIALFPDLVGYRMSGVLLCSTMMFKFLMFLYGFAVWLTDRSEGDQ
ncbi:hypothetical protein ACK34W_04550 [Aeromonas veronii]